MFFGKYTTLYFGKLSNKRLIRHQACCIVVSSGEPIEVHTADQRIIRNKMVVIPSMFRHQLVCRDHPSLFVFIEPNFLISKHHTLLSHSLNPSYLPKQALLHQMVHGAFGEKECEAIDQMFQAQHNLDLRVHKAMEYIKAHVSTELPTQSIAETVFLSESRLQHLFKENVGIPIRKYIHWQRLMEASRAIMNGQRFTSAALQSGFSDAAHFSRMFGQMFGMTPSSIFKT